MKVEFFGFENQWFENGGVREGYFFWVAFDRNRGELGVGFCEVVFFFTTKATKKNRTKPTEFSKILVSSLRYFSVDFVLKKNIGHAFNRGEHEEKPHKVHGVF